jgi:hypothetical protein
VEIVEAGDFAVAEFDEAMISDGCESTRQLTLAARLALIARPVGSPWFDRSPCRLALL